MRIAFIIIGIIAVILLINIAFSGRNRLSINYGHDNKEKNIVRYPPSLAVFFAFAAILLSIFALLIDYIFQTEDPENTLGVKILFFVLALLSVMLCLALIMWKIEYDADGFTYRNFFGIKKKYQFNHLEFRKNGDKCYFLLKGKKVVALEKMILNVDYLEVAYRKCINNQRIS